MARKVIVALTPEEANAVVAVSLALCERLGGGKRGSTLGRFSTAGVKVDEAMVNQSRPWERCEVCGGSGWVEAGSDG